MDSWKFLDHFKSYFGSQISSQSLNEIHICWLQPKSATKGDFFHIFLSLIVSSRWLMLPFDVWPSFSVTTMNASLSWFWQDNHTHNWTFSDCNFFRSFSAVFNCRSLFKKAAYLGPSTSSSTLSALFTICNPWCWLETIKHKNKWKKSPFAVDFGCNR